VLPDSTCVCNFVPLFTDAMSLYSLDWMVGKLFSTKQGHGGSKQQQTTVPLVTARG
jgi:hypothetical protein